MAVVRPPTSVCILSSSFRAARKLQHDALKPRRSIATASMETAHSSNWTISNANYTSGHLHTGLPEEAYITIFISPRPRTQTKGSGRTVCTAQRRALGVRSLSKADKMKERKNLNGCAVSSLVRAISTMSHDSSKVKRSCSCVSRNRQ